MAEEGSFDASDLKMAGLGICVHSAMGDAGFGVAQEMRSCCSTSVSICGPKKHRLPQATLFPDGTARIQAAREADAE